MKLKTYPPVSKRHCNQRHKTYPLCATARAQVDRQLNFRSMHGHSCNDPGQSTLEPMSVECSWQQSNIISGIKRKSDDELDCAGPSKKLKSHSYLEETASKNTKGESNSKCCVSNNSESNSDASQTSSESYSNENQIPSKFYDSSDSSLIHSFVFMYEENEEAYNVKPDVVQELNSKYKEMGLIGKGGFSEVLKGERMEDSLPVAIKKIAKTRVLYEALLDSQENVTRDDLPTEVDLLFQLGAGPDSNAESPVTLRLLDWFDTGPEIVLIFERPEPCYDLHDYIVDINGGPLSEERSKIIFRQLVEGALEMVDKRVFHGDIKPENIMVMGNEDSLKAKFIDFGLGTNFVPGQVFKTEKGTQAYHPPELLRGDYYKVGSTTVWQLGLVLYVMLTGRMPLKNEEAIRSFRAVPIPKRFPDDLRDLLKGCLHKDPKYRYTLEMMVNHPWLST